MLGSPAGSPGREQSSVVRTAGPKCPPPAALCGRCGSSPSKSRSAIADMYERPLTTQSLDATANLFTCHIKWQGHSLRRILLTHRTSPPAGQAGRGARENPPRSVTCQYPDFPSLSSPLGRQVGSPGSRSPGTTSCQWDAKHIPSYARRSTGQGRRGRASRKFFLRRNDQPWYAKTRDSHLLFHSCFAETAMFTGYSLRTGATKYLQINR